MNETEFIKLLKPQNIFMEKVRFGPSEDGGYVVPKFVLENSSCIFTYGVGNDSRFEVEYGDTYKKPSYLFDHTIRQVVPEIDQTEAWNAMDKYWADHNCYFYPHGLGFTDKCKDYNDDYVEMGITGYTLLKIDIEGGEYDYFLQVDVSKLGSTVMGLSLEVHWINDPTNRDNLVKILKRLNEHFILCHVHGNNWGDIWEFRDEILPVTLELTFINKKFVEKHEPDNQIYPIEGLDIPNRPGYPDYSLAFLSPELKETKRYKLPIGDIVDRYTICKLKYERTELDNSAELDALSNEISLYNGIDPFIEKLHEINGKCWDMESEIRKGRDEDLGFEEIGKRAVKLRDLNVTRTQIKNEINTKYKEGFVDIKMDHGSEIDEKSLVVTLTTVPERLEHNHPDGIRAVIKSLCEQNDNDYSVHFNIPKVNKATQKEYYIPKWLEEYKLKYPHLKIFRPEDIGPPTKMVPTLRRLRDPETIILVVDDDLIYHPDMITEHRRHQKELPDSAICYDGQECVDRYNDMRDRWISCVTKLRQAKMIQHYKSASYKKKLFDKRFDKYLEKTLSDDILVSRYFNHAGITIYVPPYEPEVHLFETLELWTKNMGVTTFPVLRHAHNVGATGCNHPKLLELPNGGRFYEPPEFRDKNFINKIWR